MIVSALQEVGAARSIVIDENNIILAGNGVIDAAAEAGIEHVRVVEADGNTIIAVRRTGLTPEQKIRLALFDNRTAEIAEWDPAILADLRELVNVDDLWEDWELAELIPGDLIEPPEDPGAQIDKAAELQEKWQVQRGQVWEIGKHRLMCGDSTSAEDVARLMAAEKLTMLWTDPPYGVAYGAKNRYLQTIGPANRLLDDIVGDDMPPSDVLVLACGALSNLAARARPGAVAYSAAPAGPLHAIFIEAMNKSGFMYRHQLIWLKNQLVFGRSDYMYKHEPILYGWLQDGAHYFEPVSNNCTVFEFDKPRANKLHPTEKPVELVAAMIQNSSKSGEGVADPFLGSGTTMVAAEQTGRVCFGMEICEKYCAVTLERMAEMGLEARLVDGD